MNLNNILALPKSTILDKKEYDEVVKKIPLNPIATDDIIANLKKLPTDEKPLDLIFAVKFKESKNDRLYTIEAYKNIVNQILTTDVFIPVCYGHQDKERVRWEGRKIVGSCIGALLDEQAEVVYYRIIPDASKDNEDIRRWIRNKQINSISIWGFSDSEENAQGIEVVKNFSLLSIDFVPPLTEGQENISLVIGENYNKVSNRIIVNPKNNMEANMSEEKLQIENLTNESIQREVTLRMKDGRLSLQSLASEMRCKVLTGEEVETNEQEKANLKNELDSLLVKAKNLGFKNIDELFDFAQDSLKKFEEEKLQGEFKNLKEDVMKEKGLLENGKPKGRLGLLIDRYAPIKQGMNRDEIKAVIEKMLLDKEIIIKANLRITDGTAINMNGEMLGKEKTKTNEVFEI